MAVLKRERCLKLQCLIGFEGCEVEWLGDSRSEMWAVCAKCGKRRVFLKRLEDLIHGHS